MKATVIRYGWSAALLMLGLGLFNLFIPARFANYDFQEVAGYLSILLSMIFVFMGIHQYRNRHNGVIISFGKALKVGLLIVLIPAIMFGLFDLLYTEVLNPGWKDDYYNACIQRIKNSTTPGKLQATIEKANREKELFNNPLMQFLIMSGTVFIIGFIVTIISAVTFRPR